MSAWELTAVLLAVAYLLLAIRQNRWCWVAAFISAAIFLVLMFQARLYMQSLLQVFYAVMAIYGWWKWHQGDGPTGILPVRRWPGRYHMAALVVILISGLSLGWLLMEHSDAAWPWLDAVTATGAVVTTWMVARKILENWIYWFVIDSVSVFLYASQGLLLTAALFIAYLPLVVLGFRQWRRSMDAHV